MEGPIAPKNTGLGNLFETLALAGVEYAGSLGGKGGQFFCPNPEHNDEHASFDVHVGTKGIPIFTCTPCREAMGQDDFLDVLRDRGITWKGRAVTDATEIEWGAAAPSSGGSGSGSTGETKLSVVYTYKHADGSNNFKVMRYDPVVPGEGRKRFSPARWDTKALAWSGGAGALDAVQRTPLGLERFAKWAGKPIYLVEGEKAVLALWEARKPATTFHGGTNGKLESGWTDWFTDFAEVRISPDADEAGVERALALMAQLTDAGITATFWGVSPETAQPKDDAYDALDRGEPLVPLSTFDLERYRALHPMPVAPKSKSKGDRSSATVNHAAVHGLFGGKPLVLGTDDGVVDVESLDDVIGPSSGAAFGSLAWPFKTKLNVDPVKFTREYAEHLLTDDEGILTLRYHADEAIFYLWDARKRHYVPLLDEIVKARIATDLVDRFETDDSGQIMEIRVKESSLKAVLDALKSVTVVNRDFYWSDLGQEIDPARGGVPFLNGWLDVVTKELVPTGPFRDNRWSVPMEYDADRSLAEGSEWFNFLDSLGWTAGSQERKLLREWMGYLLSGSKAQQKIMLLLGPKRAGKGTILKVCSAMMGHGAVGTQLDTLTGEFGLQNLRGKSLAVIGDARFTMKTDKRTVERLLSLAGDDLMSVNVKNKDILSVRLDARLMIATNEQPDFIEASDALASRFVVLNFTETFYGREDLTLDTRILEELPGIVRWALGGLIGLEKRGHFTETDSGKEVQRDMIQSSAPIRVFVEERAEIGENYTVSNEDLYEAYRSWCQRGGHYMLNAIRFNRDLLTAFVGQIENTAVKRGGKTTRAKRGIRLAT